jgi:transcriptional regulator with XRE-family HTH domain
MSTNRNPNEFSRLLFKYLGIKGWTTAELANRLGVSRTTIWHWGRGDNIPTNPKTIADLANTLQMTDEDREGLLKAAGFVVHSNEFTPEPSKPFDKGSTHLAPLPEPAVLPSEMLRTYRTFQGRSADLEVLLNRLIEAHGLPIIAIEGLGGIGKTALAQELMARAFQANAFEGYVWTSAKAEFFEEEEIQRVRVSHYTLDTFLNAIATQCQQPQIMQARGDDKIIAVRALLAAHRLLIVLDNLETIKDYKKMIFQISQWLGQSRLLVTSRVQTTHSQAFCVSLRGLTLLEGIEFLRSESAERGIEVIQTATEESLKRMHSVTGGAPLAMKLIIGQHRHGFMEEILRQLIEAKYGEQNYPFYRFIYYHAWQMLNDDAKRVLVGMSYMSLTHGAYFEELLETVRFDSSAVMKALADVVARCLIEKSITVVAERFVLHPLTQYFVKSDIRSQWEGHASKNS